MIEEFYAIVSSDNVMNLQDIKNECMEQSWVPLGTKFDKSNNESKIIIFYSLSVAKSFVKRNYNKKELIGIIKMPYSQIKQFEKNSIKIEFLDWPNSYKNSSQYSLGIEVVSLIENPDLKLHNEAI